MLSGGRPHRSRVRTCSCTSRDLVSVASVLGSNFTSRRASEGHAPCERALTIDATLSEGHGFIGCVKGFFERDSEAGERSLRRAVELGPNIGINHANLAALLVAEGRFDQGIAAAKLAQRLDPLSPTVSAWTYWWFGYAGLLEEGVTGLERTIALHPNHWLPHHALGDIFSRLSRMDEAIEESAKAVELSSENSIAVAQLACLNFLADRRDLGEELLAALTERSRQSYVPPTFMAWIHLARGDTEETLRR